MSAAPTQDDFLENGAGKFKVEIDGCPITSANVLDVRIDDIVIEAEEIPNAEPELRWYRPGRTSYGNVTLRAGIREDGTSSELFAWWLEASRGKNIRKNISVICLKRDGSEARRFTLLECYPLRWDPGDYSPSTRIVAETIVCKMGRVELAATLPGTPTPGKPLKSKTDPRTEKPNNMLALLGFSVEIKGEGEASEPDSAWEACTGGSLAIEEPDSAVSSEPFGGTTPGHKYIDTLTLRGPVTASRKQMMAWIQASSSGGNWKRNLAIREITKDGSNGRSFNYLDCFPVRYTFPRFSADGTGNLYEEVVVKPIRLELK